MKMTGYTKLFGSIVASTIWREPNEVRIVWITMLAMANKTGLVEASLPGLADLSRVSIEECKVALVALESPDEYSRTPDHEGRRIQKVDGGWSILNHGKYRAKMGADERREYLRVKQQEHRTRKKASYVNSRVNKCSDSSTESTHAEAYSDAEAFQPLYPPSAGDEAFEEFWKAYPRKAGKGPARAAWKKHKCASLLPKILVSVRACKISPDWTKEGGQFIPHPATWLNREGWNDELSTDVKHYGNSSNGRNGAPSRNTASNAAAASQYGES